ncbi:glutarate dioxygenase GlaH [Halalkalibacter wakoensis]|uniref:glutarate dioxygenase GlaH n=1 Tax=Halalkalibacter wakoensis TaxID=127891 RepID=UPI0005526CDF|nr:glutarate dioxygenase GlaH [Halalkalibacter wakoensis]
MSTVKQENLKFAGVSETYEVQAHPQSNRLYHISMKPEIVKRFFQRVRENDISVQRLEYTPYERHVVAGFLLELSGSGLQDVILNILHDRDSGGFTIGVQGEQLNTDDYVIFSTALAHLAGLPNHDAMSNKYYARFTVKDTDDSDSYLRQAYRLFTMHTDGTFVDEPTDWLLMMKMHEAHAKGGESRLLHLDDWEDLEKFSTDPLASHEFTYKAPPSKNVAQEIKRTVFFKVNNKPCICFIDQFAHPESIEEANYLKNLSHSMESDKNVIELELPVGDLVMVNNLFWLHGRAAFEKNPLLDRELLRQRGRFTK